MEWNLPEKKTVRFRTNKTNQGKKSTNYLKHVEELKPLPIIEFIVHVTVCHSKQHWLAAVFPVDFMEWAKEIDWCLCNQFDHIYTHFIGLRALFGSIQSYLNVQFYFVWPQKKRDVCWHFCDFTPSYRDSILFSILFSFFFFVWKAKDYLFIVLRQHHGNVIKG